MYAEAIAASWVEVAVPRWGEGPKGFAAEVCADGRIPRRVENLGTEDVLAALDRAHGLGADAEA